MIKVPATSQSKLFRHDGETWVALTAPGKVEREEGGETDLDAFSGSGQSDVSTPNMLPKRARQRHAREFAQREQNFKAMSELAPVMMWMCDENGRHFYLNGKLREFLGIAPAAHVKLDWRAIVHPDDAGRLTASISQAIAHRAEARVNVRYRNMKHEYRIVEINVTPRYSPVGAFVGLVGVTTDITDRDRAEARRNLLTAELGHRVKNILAVVMSIAHRTLRSASSLDDAREMFEGRMISLARAHDILIQRRDEVASMTNLVTEGLAAHGIDRKRAKVGGPETFLPASYALSLALVLHELCTNALKYGALSNDRGAIDLSWSVSQGGLHIVWKERGGPVVEATPHRGFGSIMIERALADVDATITRAYDPDGFVCRISIALSNPKSEPAQTAPEESA